MSSDIRAIHAARLADRERASAALARREDLIARARLVVFAVAGLLSVTVRAVPAWGLRAGGGVRRLVSRHAHAERPHGRRARDRLPPPRPRPHDELGGRGDASRLSRRAPSLRRRFTSSPGSLSSSSARAARGRRGLACGLARNAGGTDDPRAPGRAELGGALDLARISRSSARRAVGARSRPHRHVGDAADPARVAGRARARSCWLGAAAAALVA